MSSSGTSGTATPTSTDSGNPRRAKICVYCGSSPGSSPAHVEAARDLARVMAANNVALVYGGGTVGLMGEIAKTLVSLSGPDSVHGIIPEALVRYERDPSYTVTGGGGGGVEEDAERLAVPEERVFGKTTVVKDMHTRKRMMVREVVAGGPGSGFIALSGGFGTMEELFETVTWNQLGIHGRGICVLNINGMWDGVFDWVRRTVQEGFIREGNQNILVQATDAEGAVRALRDYKVSESVLKLAWGSE